MPRILTCGAICPPQGGPRSLLPPAPHYEPCQDYILQGDIGYFPFAQIVLPTESESLPGPASTNPRVPAFEGMITHDLVVDDVTYQLRQWRGLGMVIDATSELANSPDDNRVTVIPIVTRRGRRARVWRLI